MFFDMDLLCLKRNGKFALIWLAANQGIPSIGKTETERVDIIKTCDDILRYLTSRSTSPRNRISLYLSAKLLYGTVLVYREQVLNLQKMAVGFICLIRIPPRISLIPDDVDLEDTPKKRGTKRKRKGVPQQEPNAMLSLEEQQIATIRECEDMLRRSLPRQDVNLIDASSVTLRDEVRPSQRPPDMDLFGDEGQIDIQLAQYDGDGLVLPDALKMPPPPPPAITPAPLPDLNFVQEPDPTTRQLPTPTSRKRPHSPDVEQSPQTRRRIAENIIEVAEQQPAEPVVVQPVSVVPPPLIPRRRRPYHPIRGNMNTSVRSLNLNDLRALNRADLSFEAIGRNVSGRVMSPRPRNVDPVRIMELLLSGVRISDGDVSAVFVEAPRQNITLESSGANLTVPQEQSNRSFVGLRSPLAPEPVQELAPIAAVAAQIDEPAMEMIPEHGFPSPPRLDRVQEIGQDISPILEQGQGDAPISPHQRPRMQTSTPVKTENREQNLLHRLRTMFSELPNEEQYLTIDHIAFPLTRMNIARAFADLLTLQSKGYVILTSAPNSLELQYIKPGVKLFA